MSLFAAAVSGRPRYLMIDLNDVEFVGEQQNLPVVPMGAMFNQRFARDIGDEDEPGLSPFRQPQISSRSSDITYPTEPKGIE